MQFPEKPTIHYSASSVFKYESMEPKWREPRQDETYGRKETFRTCCYCGSIHPEDLVNALRNGARLGGSDWKYGWPHKFHVEGIPNPLVGQNVVISETHPAQIGPYAPGGEKGPPKEGWPVDENGKFLSKPTYGPAPATVHAKWYNEHLLDQGFDDEARELLINALKVHSNIEFKIVEGMLGYAAPCRGYQR
jgi:hypothetical protein